MWQKVGKDLWLILFNISFLVENFLYNYKIAQSLYLTIPTSCIFLTYKLFKEKTILNKYEFQKVLPFILIYLISILYSTYTNFDLIKEDLTPFFRQMTSFSLGCITLLAFYNLFKEYKKESFANYTLFFSFIPLTIGLYQFFNNEMIKGVPRVSSLYTEPGHYGDYLVWILLPMIIFKIKLFKLLPKAQKVMISIILALFFINAISTQSNLLFLKLIIILGFSAIFIKTQWQYKLYCLIAILAAVSIATMLENSYIKTYILLALNNINNPSKILQIRSFADRLYPLYAIASNILKGKILFGSGLGADWYLRPFPYSAETFNLLTAIKRFYSIMNSLIPKIILYFGFIPTLPIAFILYKKLKQSSTFEKIFFLSILVSSLFTLGNFSFPFFWFWFAIVILEDDKTERTI